MIRHFFKLAWNRRRANGLIFVELLCSFLVLCGVLAAVVYNLDQWRRPMGVPLRGRVGSVGRPGTFSNLSDETKLAIARSGRPGSHWRCAACPPSSA